MRIRSIKPEFWRSPDIRQLDWDDRLLFIGLWSYVDDNGVGRDDVPSIIGDLFAGDMFENPRETVARVSRGLQNLSEAGRIARYPTEKGDCLYIVNWNKHQRIDKPNKARLDAPPPELQASGGDSRGCREGVARVQEIPAPGTGEQGNRGTGEETLSRTGSAVAHMTEPDTFDQFWNTYPRKADKKKARTAYKAALKRADPDTILRGAQAYADDPNRDDAYTKYPASWLNADAWDNDPLPARGQTSNAQDRRAHQIVDLVARNMPGMDDDGRRQIGT
ncbi:hypothetical protein [Nesterenkonia suensis]